MRSIAPTGAALALVACASAPAPKAPPQVRAAPSASAISQTLELCPGGGISNAPAADFRRRIIGFEPLTHVSGAMLARAPVSACVSSGFGPRRGGAGRFHKGVDLYTRSPAPVYAGGDGVVAKVGVERGYGNVVVIRHNGRVTTRYAHLSAFAPGLKPGAHVRRGERIGTTGRTGNATAVHLHYEIRVGGAPQNPLTVGG